MDTFPLLVLLLSCRIEAVGALNLSPGTLTVLRGEKARFTCIPSNSQWTVMIWLVGGDAALTISNETGVLPSINPNVMAEKKEGGWMFVLNNTERHNQGEVTCDLQGIDRKTARLFVQEKGSVKVLGENRLAFQGQSVLFQCQAAGWHPEPVLKWQVNDKEVNHSEYNISSEESGESLFTLTSNLSVLAAKSSHVDCLASVSALPKPLKSRISLKVVAEVLQEGGDCTVPVAITASLSAFLLLILLCICTVLCYRQRRQAKTSPQEVLRFDQSVFGRTAVAEVPEGKVNLGYSSEGATGVTTEDHLPPSHPIPSILSHQPSAYPPSLHPLIFSVVFLFSFLLPATFARQEENFRIKTESSMALQVPDVVYSSSFSTQGESQASTCPPEESSTNVRRITTV